MVCLFQSFLKLPDLTLELFDLFVFAMYLCRLHLIECMMEFFDFSVFTTDFRQSGIIRCPVTHRRRQSSGLETIFAGVSPDFLMQPGFCEHRGILADAKLPFVFARVPNTIFRACRAIHIDCSIHFSPRLFRCPEGFFPFPLSASQSDLRQQARRKTELRSPMLCIRTCGE